MVLLEPCEGIQIGGCGVLAGTRPRIDVIELIVLALIGERPGLGPGAHDQVVRLGEALLRLRRIDAHGVIFGADAAHEAGDEAAAREVVEHRVFLGNHQRIVEQRQRAAEDRELGALDAARERAGEHARDRHHAVGGLVVLVEADAVEAELVGELHLVEIFVIELGALLRDRRCALENVTQAEPLRVDGVEVDVAIGHQVEVEELHAARLIAVDEVLELGDERRRLLHMRHVSAFRNDHDFRSRDQLADRRRHNPSGTAGRSRPRPAASARRSGAATCARCGS